MNPIYGLHIEADSTNAIGALMAKVKFVGAQDAIAITGHSTPADGYGVGGQFIGGSRGLEATATSYTYPGPVVGIWASAYSDAGSAYAIYGLSGGVGEQWAGYFEGNAAVKEVLSVGTDTAHADAQVQINVPSSGNFPHVRIESPGTTDGFGINFVNATHEWLVGQNIGNWNDGRFSIYPGGSFNGIHILQNGDMALTTSSLLTPFARLQVPQKGSLNNGGLDLDNAAIYIGRDSISGMAFDENQIETVGGDLYLNFNSSRDIRLAEGGGKVGVDAGAPVAPLHVGEGHTVLFGKDTIGDGTVGSKFMFFPGKDGALRAGYLSYDGSVGNGTTFWDPDSVAWASIAIGNNTRATGLASTAIGLRTHADNTAAVALGHLSRTKGNSAFAAGYYTRADAFVSAVVGAGNVGGGNPDFWVATDPIFEIGNSIDTADRSNAFTVLKNGRVGINHRNPQAMLDIEQPNSGIGNGVLTNLAGIGHWETAVDNAADYNFYFNNVLKAYILDTDGSYVSTSDRRLKRDIYAIDNVLDRLLKLEPSTYRFCDASDNKRSVGVIAQNVQAYFPDLVHEKDGYLGVNYQGLGVIAIKALQELAEEQESIVLELSRLKAENDQLREQLEHVMTRLDAMEKRCAIKR